MLKVSQKIDHALLLMRLLAKRQTSAEPLSLDGVARAEGISHGYLEEVAGLLRAAGLVEGRRGAGGGYVISKPAADVTVADVVTAIEGATWLTQCLGESRERFTRPTGNDTVWHKVQGQVMTTLRAITIADLVAQELASVQHDAYDV